MGENSSQAIVSQSASLALTVLGMDDPDAQSAMDELANVKIPALAKDTTPMMAQYIEIKAANPDCLLFYRMGDFYELFFTDAEIASRALGITLTKRGKHNGEDIPMCGVPVHAAQDYLKKLIALKYRVAVCEQTEDPKEAKKRGSKAVVRREVERVVTAGTILDDGLLAPQQSNFLASIALAQQEADQIGLAFADISTGELYVTECVPGQLQDRLMQIEAAELISPQKLIQDFGLKNLLAQSGTVLAPLSAQASVLDDLDGVITQYARAIGADWGWAETLAPGTKLALAQLLSYIDRTQYGGKPHLARVQSPVQSQPVQIDMATRRSLELVRTQTGETKGSLLHAIDRTQTAQGRRMLNQRINAPLTDIALLEHRLDQVELLHQHSALLYQLRALLKKCPDHARALTRLEVARGGPKDLKNLVAGLRQTFEVAALLARELQSTASLDGNDQPVLVFDQILSHLQLLDMALLTKIDAALEEQCPLLVSVGQFIVEGVDEALDEARHLKANSQSVIASLQQAYRDDLGVGALKIKFNNVWGYFVEVPSAHGEKLLQSEDFFHKQTLANAMRFTSSKLQALEGEIAGADQTIQAREKALFETYCAELLAHNEAIKLCDQALAELDIAASNAQLAVEQDYCRPKLDRSRAFNIEKGRHPVVEQALKKAQNQSFVANDCDLSAQDGRGAKGAIWLVTGPNMGGKSTFLRQNAVIAILAQIGCFVPADSAHIGVADKIFSRVGATDDLAGGRSTFMVEMSETAQILNHATQNSLVILDEIGRGTATFDGLSIAWAALEHIHDVNKARAIFATHYHELTALGAQYQGIENHALKVSEHDGNVLFLHELEKGHADRSYGIQVARLAGLPSAVITRARLILDELEQSNRTDISSLVDELPLFQAMAIEAEEEQDDPILAHLNGLDADELTPKQALEEIYTLIQMAKGKG